MTKYLYLALFLLSFSVFATIPESSLTFKGNLFSYYANQDLLKANHEIETAVIVVHGSERNADTYFNSMVGVATKIGKIQNTIVIAPHYKEANDVKKPGEFSWSPEGWLSGAPSLINRTVSSFEIIDHFVDLLANSALYPKLKTIVITGHSAGGQLTQRYALGNISDVKYKAIHFKYVVANPGSYTYLSAKRNFEIPVRPACAYNDYKYGLDNLNAYMKRIPVKTMITLYIYRDVTYLLGELDNVAEGIDQDCPARYQGDTRLHRGQNFKAELDFEFPTNSHDLAIVPAVAHTQWGMYNSATGTNAIFGN